MIFEETALKGAYVVLQEPVTDERGSFARTWCADEFAKKGLNSHIEQCNLTMTKLSGTIRGLHYQAKPSEEAKFVQCLQGSIFDVIVDLRPTSTTYLQWTSMELKAGNNVALYIPEGFAHGLQTLQDNSQVLYQMSAPYHANVARGIRWNDPLFKIRWPINELVISKRDQAFADFDQ